MNTSPTALGVDLGGTAIKLAVVSAHGEVLSRETCPTGDGETENGRPAWAERVRGLVAGWRERLGGAEGCVVGVAAPGLATRDGRAIASMPGRMRGLEHFDWTEFLGGERPVRVLNDAHAALLGEAWLGAARGARNVVMLTLGTGVGGAIMVNGQLLEGRLGRAGHLGHICLDPDGPPSIMRTPGALENFLGECTLAQRTGGRFTTTADLLTAHAAGDPAARAAWDRFVHVLGCALASFVNVLDPDLIILGGGVTQAGEALWEPLRRTMAEVEWLPEPPRPVPILPAELGAWAGAYGAARRALADR